MYHHGCSQRVLEYFRLRNPTIRTFSASLISVVQMQTWPPSPHLNTYGYSQDSMLHGSLLMCSNIRGSLRYQCLNALSLFKRCIKILCGAPCSIINDSKTVFLRHSGEWFEKLPSLKSMSVERYKWIVMWSHYWVNSKISLYAWENFYFKDFFSLSK